MELYNNLSLVAQCDEFGNYKESVKGCIIEESDATGALFVTKQRVLRDGSLKERKYVLPKGMTAEEYLKIERQLEGNEVESMLNIKSVIRATAKEISDLKTRALEFYATPAGYAMGVVMNWSRTQIVNFILREERVA